MSILSAAMILFLMMDPIGNVPLFAALLKDVDSRRRSWVVLRENLIALVMLLFFLGLGPTLMGLLHIEQPALNIAGGVVLFIVSLQMIFPRKGGIYETQVDGEPFIVPLAIPLIAGPSTMAVVMLMSTREPQRRLDWVIALLAAWGVGLVILLLANRLRPLFGPRGLLAIERLMGMVLLVLAVQMSLRGIETFVQEHVAHPATR